MSDSPSPLACLLDVQARDIVITQLHHRRTHLPEAAELTAVQARIAEVTAQVAEPTSTVNAFDRRQTALEDEIAATTAKIADADRRLYSGTVTSSRELQALEADIASLKKRRAELEDLEIEILVEREPLDEALSGASAERSRLQQDVERLQTAISDGVAAIDADAAANLSARAELAAAVPGDLLATYDRIRKSNNGIGIARLEHGTCMACRLQLSAVDIDRVRHQPPGTATYCEQCGSILVV